jgi:hypothetical protein
VLFYIGREQGQSDQQGCSDHAKRRGYIGPSGQNLGQGAQGDYQLPLARLKPHDRDATGDLGMPRVFASMIKRAAAGAGH